MVPNLISVAGAKITLGDLLIANEWVENGCIVRNDEYRIQEVEFKVDIGHYNLIEQRLKGKADLVFDYGNEHLIKFSQYQFALTGGTTDEIPKLTFKVGCVLTD